LKFFSPEAMELMKDYDWPGNVRELKNIVERLVIMTPGTRIDIADLPGHMTAIENGRESIPQRLDNVLECSTLREAREEFEKEFILQKLEENNWNVSKTAEIIELERSNLYRKMKSYGIDLKK
jgi:two-component system nitrogen regulation response regulator NtrX